MKPRISALCKGCKGCKAFFRVASAKDALSQMRRIPQSEIPPALYYYYFLLLSYLLTDFPTAPRRFPPFRIVRFPPFLFLQIPKFPYNPQKSVIPFPTPLSYVVTPLRLVPTLVDVEGILCYIKKKKVKTHTTDQNLKVLGATTMICKCSEPIDPRRVALGYHTCPVCGDLEARKVVRCVAPLNKSNYVLVSNYMELKQLNPKYNNA